MNRLLLLTSFLGLLTLAACHRKTVAEAEQGKGKNMPVEEPGQPSAEKDTPGDDPEVYQYAGFKKTPCYGTCPTYEVKFYTDGKVIWYGFSNVERLGLYEARVDQQVFRDIKNKSEEVDFYSFYSEYPRENKVVDLPTTITYIRFGDMEKQVRNTHDAPESLTEFENFLETLINGLTWRKSQASQD